MRERECVYLCECVLREREKERVCASVCVRERKRERVCASVCVRERGGSKKVLTKPSNLFFIMVRIIVFSIFVFDSKKARALFFTQPRFFVQDFLSASKSCF